MLDLVMITVNHNHGAQIQRAIQSLYSLPDQVKFQLLAVDNTPGDGFSQWLAKAYPDVKLIQNKQPQGFAANNNQALRLAPVTRYILLMNPDVECQPGVLEQLVGFMDANPDAGIAGPKLFNLDGTIQPSARRFLTPTLMLLRTLHIDRSLLWIRTVRGYLMHDFDHAQTADVDWVTGALLLVRYEALQQIGLMDERYFLYAEDQDWCCRMWRGGWRVCYVPQAQSIHAHIQEGFKKPWSKAARHLLASAIRMFIKFDGKLSRTPPTKAKGAGRAGALVFNFANKVVLITGGSSGIGQQIAHNLLRLGAHVIICSHQPERLEQARRELSMVGPQIDAIVCDIRQSDQIKHLIEHVLEVHGRIDMLINNAGYAVYRPFEESSEEEVLDLLDVNLAGAMRCAKAVLPSMIKRRSGQIINISSIGGETIITPNAVYCAAKHGMVAWTKALRYELAHYGITVKVVCPGHTLTHFHDHPTFRRRDAYRTKGKRSLTVEAVAQATLAAIRNDRVITFVPGRQGLIVWALNVLPALTTLVWDRMMRRRIAQLYAQIEKEKTT